MIRAEHKHLRVRQALEKAANRGVLRPCPYCGKFTRSLNQHIERKHRGQR